MIVCAGPAQGNGPDCVLPSSSAGMVVGPVQILLGLFIIDLLSVFAFNAYRKLRRVAQQGDLNACQAVRHSIPIGRDGIPVFQIIACLRKEGIHAQGKGLAVHPNRRSVIAAGIAVFQGGLVIIPCVLQHGRFGPAAVISQEGQGQIRILQNYPLIGGPLHLPDIYKAIHIHAVFKISVQVCPVPLGQVHGHRHGGAAAGSHGAARVLHHSPLQVLQLAQIPLGVPGGHAAVPIQVQQVQLACRQRQGTVAVPQQGQGVIPVHPVVPSEIIGHGRNRKAHLWRQGIGRLGHVTDTVYGLHRLGEHIAAKGIGLRLWRQVVYGEGEPVAAGSVRIIPQFHFHLTVVTRHGPYQQVGLGRSGLVGIGQTRALLPGGIGQTVLFGQRLRRAHE